MAADGPHDPPSGKRLDEALRSARLAEAAHFDALIGIRDAATLRLQVLKDELDAIVAGRREAADFFDLALVPGHPPRLWIDMVSYVVMAPDPRTYRFQRDTAGGHEVLFETPDRREMVDKITAYIAHRLIERQRQLPTAAGAADRGRSTYGGAALVLAWLCGFSLGVLALLAVGVWLAGTR